MTSWVVGCGLCVRLQTLRWQLDFASGGPEALLHCSADQDPMATVACHAVRAAQWLGLGCKSASSSLPYLDGARVGCAHKHHDLQGADQRHEITARGRDGYWPAG